MATTIVHYQPGQNPTVKAAEDLTGGTFVTISADIDGRNPVVKTAVAGARVFGVAAHDVTKDGHVMVYRAGHIVTVKATGSIAAGDPVEAGAKGAAAKGAGTNPTVGTAVSKSVDNAVIVALS